MPNQNLIDYIKESKEKGFPDKEIRKALLDAGWKKEDVKGGFKAVGAVKFKAVGEVKKIAKKSKSKWLVLVIVVIVIIVVVVAGLIVALNFDTIRDWFKLVF